jgi:2,4-dienoyl-CoA reductase-like NADH-dependent reductase (Old Yellow Enzyme family)
VEDAFCWRGSIRLISRAMKKDEIYALIESREQAARRAKAAGFDMELHM